MLQVTTALKGIMTWLICTACRLMDSSLLNLQSCAKQSKISSMNRARFGTMEVVDRGPYLEE